MFKRNILIINKLGLHTRAAAKFVNLASSFEAEIYLVSGNRKVSGKNIMGIMMLAAGCGTSIDLYASGPEAQQALTQLQDLILRRFDESE